MAVSLSFAWTQQRKYNINNITLNKIPKDQSNQQNPISLFLKLILGLFGFWVSSTHSIANMRWEKIQIQTKNGEGMVGPASFGPGKRWGHTCNSIRGGKFLYVFGGYGKDNCQTNQVHIFDTGGSVSNFFNFWCAFFDFQFLESVQFCTLISFEDLFVWFLFSIYLLIYCT